MVDRVSNDRITFAELPYRLEAGTPNIAGVIGFNAILNWLQNGILPQQNSTLYPWLNPSKCG